MKILYHHRTRSADGQRVHIDGLIGALRRSGHEVVLVAPGGAETTAFGAGAGTVARLKRFVPASAYEAMELAYSAVAYRRLDRAVRRHRPDVIYERYNLFLTAGLWAARRHGIPLLLEVNAPLAEERTRFDGLRLRRAARAVERVIWTGADAVLPVTEVLAGHIRAAGVPDERISVIPNGIEPARFGAVPEMTEAKRAWGLDGRLVLGFTGFVRAWHGLDRVLETMAADRHPYHLLVAGEGPAIPALRDRARDLGVADRVTFAGLVARDHLPMLTAAFDIALQPAVVPYASPLKLFEYMAMGRAIAAPGTPNIREILTHGHDALLFDPADPAGLPAAIETLARDTALRARLGAAARRTVLDRGLTWDDNARRVAGLAADLLSRSARGRSVRSHADAVKAVGDRA